MCGINGYQGHFQENLIDQMNDSISHRGPDNIGATRIDETTLGHVRLSIIDLSPKSNQPMCSRNSKFEIVFNGEIYNFKQLRGILEDDGVSFVSNGDSEVLLELWSRYEEDSLEMLNGIFSFAIFDRDTEVLTLVRDQFGVKPLYYAECDDGFIFSSEIKAILQNTTVSREINIDAVASVVELLWQPGVDTVLKSVKKLAPASIARIQNGKLVTIDTYYTAPKYNGKLTLEESLDRLKLTLERSVEEQLVADVEVGAFLSGGLDSSLLCAIAKQKQPNFSSTFSIEIDAVENKREGMIDDLPFAKSVASELGVELNIIKASENMLNSLTSCIYHLDEPQADPAILNTYKICEGAKKKGIKVLLSGAGGDDLFTGYRRHIATKYDNFLSRLPTKVRASLAKLSVFFPSSIPATRKIKKFLQTISLTGDSRLVSYFSWMQREQVESLFTPEMRSILSENYGSEVLKVHLTGKELNNIEKLLELERQYFLIDHNFNYTDKMSMAHGVEVRVPYVNKDMLKVASEIPTVFKQKGNEGKWILKQVAENWLNEKIIYRKKTGFGAPLRSWIHGPLKPLIDALLSKESVEKRGLFEYSQVAKLIDLDRKGKKDCAYSIYALLTLEIWFRQFIDSERPREISLKELMVS